MTTNKKSPNPIHLAPVAAGQRQRDAWDVGFCCALNRELPTYLDAELEGMNDPEWLIGFADGAIAGEQMRERRDEWMLEVAETLVAALKTKGRERAAGLKQALGCVDEVRDAIERSIAREACVKHPPATAPSDQGATCKEWKASQ